MPLHDRDRPDAEDAWQTVHQTWVVEIIRQLKPRSPPGHRATLAVAPKLMRLDTAEPVGHVDRVGDGGASTAGFGAGTGGSSTAVLARAEPDVEVAVPGLGVEPAVYVGDRGRMIAAIELMSPGNKDRPARREGTVERYAGSLRDRVHLVLVDVHPKPDRPTVADRFSKRFGLGRPPLPAPYAAVYRVGDFADPGHFLAAWLFPLEIGGTLPVVPVPLADGRRVALDLESAYAAAAELAYFD